MPTLRDNIEQTLKNNYFTKALYPFALIAILSCWYVYSGNLYLLYQQYWPEAVTMVLGAFVAGSTPLGGGAVAYPVLNKLLSYSSADAQLFSIMIQSIGMTCASLLYIGLARKIYWKEIVFASAISLCVPILFIDFIHIPDANAKVIFTLFELLALLVLIFKLEKIQLKSKQSIIVTLFVFAAIGGGLTSIIGSGADLMLFIYLVTIKRIKPVEAIPSTVVFMSINAVFSVLVFLNHSTPSDNIVNAWLAAVPIVAIAAPLGAWFIGLLPAKMVLNAIIYLVIFDLLSTAFLSNLPISVIILIYIIFFIILLHKFNKQAIYNKLTLLRKVI